MKYNIASLRVDYKKKELDVKDVNPNPFKQFDIWMKEAIDAELPDANAMTLATADRNGQIASRIVLLKELENELFVFYTNYESKKGKHLSENPYAAITFFWPPLERQINIRGRVTKVNEEISDKYFESRPRKSQLGAWSSKQSSIIPSRSHLVKKFAGYAFKYLGKKVPRPSFWGGYGLKPDYIEFWQGRPSRLHDRIEYERQSDDSWKISRLSP